jgi:hypothetical protein
MDDASGRGDILPPVGTGDYYGVADFDRTHVFISQVRYRFPTLDTAPAALKWVVGGWDVSSVFQAQSGAPFDIRVPNNGDTAGVGAGSGGQFYELVGDPETGRTEWDGTRAVWFNKDAFRAPASGTLATTQKRNLLRQPGFWDLHMALRKAVPVGGHRIELRWEAFNVLNATNLGGASTNATSGDFGTITSRTGNRTMQVNLNYVF